MKHYPASYSSVISCRRACRGAVGIWNVTTIRPFCFEETTACQTKVSFVISYSEFCRQVRLLPAHNHPLFLWELDKIKHLQNQSCHPLIYKDTLTWLRLDDCNSWLFPIMHLVEIYKKTVCFFILSAVFLLHTILGRLVKETLSLTPPSFPSISKANTTETSCSLHTVHMMKRHEPMLKII